MSTFEDHKETAWLRLTAETAIWQHTRLSQKIPTHLMPLTTAEEVLQFSCSPLISNTISHYRLRYFLFRQHSHWSQWELCPHLIVRDQEALCHRTKFFTDLPFSCSKHWFQWRCPAITGVKFYSPPLLPAVWTVYTQSQRCTWKMHVAKGLSSYCSTLSLALLPHLLNTTAWQCTYRLFLNILMWKSRLFLTVQL